ncbi:hypothetical protein G5S52_21675 [Grimontia sp. S25]|uniref:Uncharacterized protein n=1 Tax=Grimontia sedimenti TaxID=2711294 RepID=A0A6M1RQB7_9GAMM|nr:hypothetical protein [Grimontia sedimenti]NGO00139.1 hypothetical protein [Grimontia sedimenti]
MKLFHVVIAMFCLLSAFSSQANECPQGEKNVSFKKLTQLSQNFGKALVEGPKTTRETKAVLWINEVKSSASDIDTLVQFDDGKTALSLVEELERNTFLSEQWLAGGEPENVNSLVGLYYRKSAFLSENPDEIYVDVESGKVTLNLDAVKHKGCRAYLMGWVDAINTYRDIAFQRNAQVVSDLAIEYGKQWNRYFDEGRSQTLIDRPFTAWFYSDELSSQNFVLPPKYQLFLAHPSVLMEYVGDANDGSQFEAALAVEWLGINAWQSCFGADFACGASLVSTYSDRAGVDDIGHGLMLHVKNSYSFGATVRDGDVGYFITVDLLKAFEDKQSEVKAWQIKANEILGKETGQ